VDLTERRMVEAALQESKERYQAIFNNVKDAIFIVDSNGRVLDINAAACHLLKYSRQDILKSNLSAAKSAGNWSFPAVFSHAIPETGSHHAESEITTREGKYIPVEYFSHYIEYEKKKAVLTVVRDISERRQAEAIRKRNQTRLESLVRIAQFKAGHTRDLLYFALEELIKLTDSRLGFLYFYNTGRQEFSFNSWSKELMQMQSRKNRLGTCKLEQTGVLGEVIKQGKSLFVNQAQEPALLQNGYPEGHYRLDRYLLSPVYRNQEIVAVISVANKERDYDQFDAQQLTLLLDSVWNILERWRAEEAQRESEERYRQLIDLSRDAILRMNVNGIIAMANPAACKMFGYSEKELINMSFEETFLPQDRITVEQRMEILKENKLLRFERQAVRKDGSLFSIEVSISPLTQGYFQEVIRDITERKRVEEKIRYQAMLIEHVQDAIITTDLNSRILSWNTGAEKKYGWSQDEVLGKIIKDVVRPETPENELNDTVDLIMKTGMLQTELVHRKKDGTALVIMSTSSLIKDLKGTPTGIISVCRDITERKKIENALAESEKKYRLLVENQTNILAETSISGELLFVNPAYCKLMGKTKEELLGKSVESTIHEDDLERARKDLEPIFKPPYSISTESRMLTKNGWRWIAWTDNAVLNDKGIVTSITCLGRDITERKLAREELQKANEQLRELDKLKDNFLSTVSHELRTPLTSIKSFAEILLNYDEDKATQKEFLGIINDESDRLTRLINDFLDLSKIQAGRMQWQTVELSLADAIRSATNTARPLVDKNSLELLMYVEPNLPHVLADRDRIIQVITNILGNSVKFTPENGKITLRAWSDKNQAGENGEWATVSISDTGIGIAPENHQKIFERFGQVGDVLKDRPKGTGLGLPICKKIVEYFGGRIWLQSDLGKGTTFFFTLPAVKNETRADTPAPVAGGIAQEIHSISGKTILVVDDEANIRRLIRHELSTRGHHVIEAANGKEGVDLSRKHHPDLITLDIAMPDLNGFDVIAVLKSDPETANIPIMIVSVVEDKEKAFRLGADDYITKPISAELMIERMNRLLKAKVV
jgi:PAS domain S-box-containing protein